MQGSAWCACTNVRKQGMRGFLDQANEAIGVQLAQAALEGYLLKGR